MLVVAAMGQDDVGDVGGNTEVSSLMSASSYDLTALKQVQGHLCPAL